MNDNKVRPEDLLARDGIKYSQKEIEKVGATYNDFYQWRSYRSGLFKHFRNNSFDDYLRVSRELFWNSISTPSEDLQKLNLDFSIGFARKESMDFLSKLTSLNVKPRISGDNLDSLAIRVLQGIYKNWAFKNNEKVESFWELLYGTVNGTVASYIGYNNEELTRRYLRGYDPEKNTYNIETKKEKYWNDVWKQIVPIEDIYLPKIFERNIQKQGELIWRTQMDEQDFRAEYGKYPLSKYVFPGMRIAEDSLFFTLLGGTGTTSAMKIEVMKKYNWIKDEYTITAGGIILNKLGNQDNVDFSPMPFDHKMCPFTWGIMSPLDEKLAYGSSVPFQSKDPHKILNTAYVMMVERELRAIDPPIISSDMDSPELIFGQHKVVPVNDVNAYKEFTIKEPSNQYFNMMNSLQSNMTAINQGGDSQVVPSKQPVSAREVMYNSQLRQQSIANATSMYYDIVRQRVLLVLKTALQFYALDKYENSDKSAIRTIMAQDMPLTAGGIGNMKIRLVNEKKGDMELFLEGIRESVLNGKQTEIVEVPVSFIKDLELYVSNIELEPENSNELQLASFVENVINPMINVYVPAGVADINKVMMRHVEKMGESLSDFVSDGNVGQMMTGAGKNPQGQAVGPTQGAMLQSITGTKYGMNNSKPLPI